MAKFRKKPVVVEADQFIEGKYMPPGVTMLEVKEFLKPGEVKFEYYVTTIHGQPTTVVNGDWIIREPDGQHYYPCKPDIFEATYEPVGEEGDVGEIPEIGPVGA